MPSKYTEEIVAFLVKEYTELRNDGELNRDILDSLCEQVFTDFDVELTPPSVRAKLNSTEDGEGGFVYQKDTEGEKEAMAALKLKNKTPKGPTKADLGATVAARLNMHSYAGDFAKLRKPVLIELVENLPS